MKELAGAVRRQVHLEGGGGRKGTLIGVSEEKFYYVFFLLNAALFLPQTERTSPQTSNSATPFSFSRSWRTVFPGEGSALLR